MSYLDKEIHLFFIQIRFAMMTSSQLAQLLLNPLSVTHTDLLLRRARIGICITTHCNFLRYHSMVTIVSHPKSWSRGRKTYTNAIHIHLLTFLT